MTNQIISILGSGLDYVRNNSPIAIILTVIGLIVILFLLAAVFDDLAQIIKEMLFKHWLKKDGNFTKFTTEKEARDGYAYYLEQKKYASMTKSWRKKYEKTLKNKNIEQSNINNIEQPNENQLSIDSHIKQTLTLKEKFAKFKKKLSDFWEALDYINMSDVKEFFLNLFRKKSSPPAEKE